MNDLLACLVAFAAGGLITWSTFKVGYHAGRVMAYEEMCKKLDQLNGTQEKEAP